MSAIQNTSPFEASRSDVPILKPQCVNTGSDRSRSDNDNNIRMSVPVTLHTKKYQSTVVGVNENRSTTYAENESYGVNTPSPSSLSVAVSSSSVSMPLPPLFQSAPIPQPEKTRKGVRYLKKEDIDRMVVQNPRKLKEYRAGLEAGSRDWTREFNEALELPLTNADERRVRADAITRIAQDFADTAEKLAKLVIFEHIVSMRKKGSINDSNDDNDNNDDNDDDDDDDPVPMITTTNAMAGNSGAGSNSGKNTSKFGGKAGGKKCVHENIFFKLPDNGSKIYHSEDYAMKTATLELLGYNTLLNIWVPGLYFPLTAVIDYLGYRVNATAVLPIKNEETLIYGSSDAGKTIFHSDKGEHLMKNVSELLNIAPHHVCHLEENFYGPFDIEVHLGFDGRLYVVDPARIMPSEVIDERCTKIMGSSLVCLHRPEFVRILEDPVNPDAMLRICTDPNTSGQRKKLQEAFNKYQKDRFVFFALKMSKLTTKALTKNPSKIDLWEKLGLIEAFHRNGFNVRHLYKIKKCNPSPSRELCILINTEIFARQIATRYYTHS